MCRINKRGGLFNIHLLFDKAIQKCTFNIHLKYLEIFEKTQASVIRMASSRATGAKIFSKSTPLI